MCTETVSSLLCYLIVNVIFWTSLVTFIFVSVPIYLVRQLLKIDWIRPKSLKLLKPEEAVYCHKVKGGLHNEISTTNVMILAVIASGEPNLDKFRNFFNTYVLKFKSSKGQAPYEKFHCYVQKWMGYSFWKRAADINLNYHVRYFDDDLGRQGEINLEELEVFLGEYNTKPFPWRTPPWEMLVVRNFASGNLPKNCRGRNKFVLLFRWHRALGDGRSMSRILVNILGGEAHQEFAMQEREGHSQDLLKNFQAYGSSLSQIGIDGFKLLLWNFDRNIWRVEEETMMGSCHLVASNKLPYNLARTVSKKGKVSITTVLYASVAGGIRNYFVQTGQERRLPRVMRIRIPLVCPIEKVDAMANTRSFTHLKLPVGQPTSWHRLYEVHKEIETTRRSFLPGFVWLLGPLHGGYPDEVDSFNFIDKRTTLAGWHFACPKQELLLLGEYPAHEILCYHPRLQTDAAIGLTILSYNGTIRFSVCIDKTLFPHRESAMKLVGLIEQEFLSLQELKGDSILD